MNQAFFKWILFSALFALANFAGEFVHGHTCGSLHTPNSFLCDFSIFSTLYVAILLGIAYGWGMKRTYSYFAFLIPMPMFIYNVIDKRTTDYFNQLRPGDVDLLQFYIFEFSLPCLLVAVAVSYASDRKELKAPNKSLKAGTPQSGAEVAPL